MSVLLYSVWINGSHI